MARRATSLEYGVAYHLEDGKIYVDTKFLNSVRIPGVSLEHMGFGEFYFMTPQGRVEVDRMRGKPFEGMSGRPHALYDDAGGQKAAEWLISEAEQRNQTEKVGSLRSSLIRLAHSNPALRPHLLPLIASEKTANVELKGKTEYFEMKPALRALALQKARAYAVDYNRENANEVDFQPWEVESLFIVTTRDWHGGVTFEIQDGTSYGLYVSFNLGTFEIDPS